VVTVEARALGQAGPPVVGVALAETAAGAEAAGLAATLVHPQEAAVAGGLRAAVVAEVTAVMADKEALAVVVAAAVLGATEEPEVSEVVVAAAEPAEPEASAGAQDS
jgi:hypothetical protein